MAGGGFLKQGQDSFEKNRAMKNKAIKGSFDKNLFVTKSKDSLSENDPKMNDRDRQDLISKIRNENRRDKLLIIGFIVFMLISLFTYFLLG
jgi:hypothetical protein